MCDYIPQISHKLEYLPNEILLEIFDYIQLNDLITIYSNNPRLVIERPLTYLILADHIIQQHINLKYLKLNLYGYWTLEKLDSFFAYIPNIKIFNLSSS
ncbi:unnamed protein product, partial [Rotaria sordida]